MINKLYKQLSSEPYRLLHSIIVAQISKSLAIIHSVDKDEAFIAGLFHDYAKYESNNFFKNNIEENEFDEYSENDDAYHGIAAANYLNNRLKLTNESYLAIRNHVFGRKEMTKLEKIVFISDSVYLNGKNNSRNIYKVATKCLDEAIILVLEMTFSHLEEKNFKPNKFQLETYNYYKEVK